MNAPHKRFDSVGSGHQEEVSEQNFTIVGCGRLQPKVRLVLIV